MKHAKLSRRRRSTPHTRGGRQKRASATQLYQTCKAAGTCPPDVIPKVEGTTIADQILKYGSMGVYFGGLGIGTGAGSGGRAGYVPLGTRPAVEPAPLPRPPITIEPVGPADPSIVTLVEETTFIESGAPAPTLPTHGGFDLTTSEGSTPAILDVSASGSNVHISVNTFTNPTFTEPSVLRPPPPVEASGRLVVSSSTVSTHSYEDIPMDTFVVTGGYRYNATSTPIPGVRPPARVGLYGRATQQVRVVDPRFLTTPARLVTYDNPAYEGVGDSSLQFTHPSIHEAPDPDFLDIVALHRPALTSRKGTIRFSRLGQRATLRTRSGKQIGARVHFYQDLSSIAPVEDIQLQPLQPLHSQNDLYDIYADVDEPGGASPGASTPRGSFTSSLSGHTSLPGNATVPLSAGIDMVVQPGPDVAWDITPAETPLHPITPLRPTARIIVYGGDFYLHPSYFGIRKRRKRVHHSFADVFVAA
ncbi:early protein L2 [Papio hamadryas papillomavirus 1]|uniref:Minor capsid protein L2 n=1 Tax=Papio hamadryas papillomavirus 1 TaxID=990303 RepID=H9LC16_RHPV1|nr:L2 gene product [Papio hamadryas papillomavirus 1]AEA35053.1 early protein L2 [Papio hamadryas papillomavirus 1]